jgi:outer membrane lipoprotein-sorting protein
MKKAFLALALSPVVLIASHISAQSSALLDRVVGHMKSVTTMTADFTQTNRNGQSVGGTLLLKRPGHVRFEYSKDTKLLIVADGNALTMVDYEVNQVQRWPIKNNPLAALLSPGSDLANYGKLTSTSTDDVISVEVRDKKRPEFGVMTLVFIKQPSAPGGYTLNGWVSLDSKNNRTSVRLSNVKFNTPIANSRFAWKDPRPAKRK